MIIKEMVMYDRERVLVGFKEIGVQKGGIECHILKKGIFRKKSVFNKYYTKSLAPDYYNMALWTIADYKRELKSKKDLLKANW